MFCIFYLTSSILRRWYSMKYLICYDIKENRIRRQIVKYLEGFAFRIQESVFSCEVSAAEMHRVQQELLALAENASHPLLLIVPICKTCERSVWMHGEPLEERPPYLLV